jgi:uncharacterized protein (DUF2236 family)
MREFLTMSVVTSAASVEEPPLESPRHDGGILGPAAVAWPVTSHPGALIGGLRALILQALHPHAMAGVAEHSDYATRGMHRLRRTAYYVAAGVFGTTTEAHKAGTMVKRMHAKVRGVDPVTGDAYSADDSETQVWVHSVEWHSFLAAYRVFGPGLTPEEEDEYFAEGAPIAALIGTPPEIVPQSVAEMRNYFESVRPRLCVSSASRTAIDFVSSPPMTREYLAVQVPLRVYANAAIALVPRELRQMAGIDRPRAVDTAAIAAARPWLEAIRIPPVRKYVGSVVGTKVRDLHLAAEAEFGPLDREGMRERRAALTAAS